MADKTVCVTHPTLPRSVCFTLKDTDKVAEKPKEKVSAETPPAKDPCDLNEECRMMSIRLRALNSAKMGYPGL